MLNRGRPSPFERLVTSMADLSQDLASRVRGDAIDRRLVLAGLAVVIGAMALAALLTGVDAGMFLNADTLYPVQFVEGNWLQYRPPPSNNWFPDVLVHWLVKDLPLDPLWQKLLVGGLLFLASALLIASRQGSVGLLVFLAAYSVAGFYFFDSTAHFSLPLCLMLWLLVTSTPVRHAVLFLSVFSDLLFLIPFSVMRITGVGLVGRSRPPAREVVTEVVLIIAAIILNSIVSEFNSGLVKLLLVLALFAASLVLVSRWQVAHLFCLLTALMLLAGSAAGLPTRYVAPIAACLLLLLVAERGQAHWSMPGAVDLAAVAVVMAVFFVGLDTAPARQLQERFACLSDTLRDRGIKAVATDHWTTKPLYFAGFSRGAEGQGESIAQVDFEEGDAHVWMGPHNLFGPPTRWAVHNRYGCALFTNKAKYCGQSRLRQVLRSERVCEIFDLIEYESPVPDPQLKKPGGKVGFAIFHLKAYWAKLLGELGID